MEDDKKHLRRYVEGFKDALAEAAAALQKNEHKEWGVQDYGAFFENKSKDILAGSDEDKGYDEGRKDAYATIGQDLKDNEFKEYSVEDYGILYQNVSREIGDCLNCENIGSEKGCRAGMTIWCPRLLETLKE